MNNNKLYSYEDIKKEYINTCVPYLTLDEYIELHFLEKYDDDMNIVGYLKRSEDHEHE